MNEHDTDIVDDDVSGTSLRLADARSVQATSSATEISSAPEAVEGPEHTGSHLSSTLPAPRTRWAAIIWGALFAAIAGWGLWIFSNAERRGELITWTGQLTPASLVGYIVLAVGVLVLLLGLIAGLRRLQRRREASAPS